MMKVRGQLGSHFLAQIYMFVYCVCIYKKDILGINIKFVSCTHSLKIILFFSVSEF